MNEVQPDGYYVECPACRRELRVNRKYVGKPVQCKFCNHRFHLDFSSSEIKMVRFFAACPHCNDEVRAGKKYLGTKAACKFCGGKIHFVKQNG